MKFEWMTGRMVCKEGGITRVRDRYRSGCECGKVYGEEG